MKTDILNSSLKPLFLFFLVFNFFIANAQNVGIGTASPTATLNTKGSLRFEGLTNNNSLVRYAVMDANGYVSWKAESAIPANNAWMLSGNVATGTSFLGTTNSTRLIFKTNNVEQMTILPNGNIGIGTPLPNRKLTIYNSLINFNNELVIRQGQGSQYGAFLTLDNSLNAFGKFWSIGSSGPLNTSGGFGLPGSLEFYQLDAGETERLRMLITPTGLVGIHVNNPAARLHVDGTVRFSNLPSGAGSVLVIGANGEIMKSSTVLTAVQEAPQLNFELENLKKEVEDLKLIVSKLENELKNLSGSK